MKQNDLLVVHKAGTPYSPINPRTVFACKRYMEAGIAGDECKNILQRAHQIEIDAGKDIFGLSDTHMALLNIIPRLSMGLTDTNIIYIKNWSTLSYLDRKAVSEFFDYRGVALPGKSVDFVSNALPKTKQERKMFEVFNMSHGLDIKISIDGNVRVANYDTFDSNIKNLLKNYFTEDGYAKNYFQNGFLSRLGLKLRSHKPSEFKTREDLLKNINKLESKSFSPKECKHILHDKNPSLKNNIEKMGDTLSNDLIKRYLLYSDFSPFIREDLLFIGTASYADSVFRMQNDMNDSYNMISSTYYNGPIVGISFSDKIIKDMDSLSVFLQDAEKISWIPRGCGTVKYLSAHEFSHALIHVYDLTRDPFIRNTELKLLNSGNMEKELSLTASMNSNEFIAEAWSEYVLSSNPRKVARNVGDRIMRFLQKEVMIL